MPQCGNWLISVAGAVLLLGGALPAGAHHSVAMYEATKTVTVEGTVKAFKWANPHVLLTIAGVVSGSGAEEQLWTLELTAPGQLSRNGWTHSTLKPGDKVKANARPLRDGKAGGLVMSVILPTGEKINR